MASEDEPLALLPRMQARPWTDGKTFTYRYHPRKGNPWNLGTDRKAAIERVQKLHGGAVLDPLDPALVAEMMSRHRKGARQRRLSFTVSEEHVRGVLKAQGNVCAITRLPFKDGKPEGARIRPWLPSLDRIKGAKGYEEGNVRVVCAFVNVAMNGFGESLFRQVLEPLVERLVVERIPTLGIYDGERP
jgi:hypothetical protein